MVAPAAALAPSVESVIARLERLPISRELTIARNRYRKRDILRRIHGPGYCLCDAGTSAQEWSLTPGQIGAIISAGYVGQIFGALFFGWLAERIGRLNVLLITVVVFTSMDLACLFAWDATSMMAFRFVQGIGTGGEVPVASAYMNEFVSAKRRGRFFLLYEVLFLFGLLSAGAHWLFSGSYLWLAGNVYRWARTGYSHNSDAVAHGGNRLAGCCPSVVLSRRAMLSLAWKMACGGVGLPWKRPVLRSVRSTKRDRTYASFSRECTYHAPSCSSHYGYAHI